MFIYKKKILFGDCDSAGILFFANLFKYMHEAYEYFIESFTNYENHFNNSVVAYPVIKATADYYSPLLLGKTAEIEVSATQIRENSFELEYVFLIDDEIKAVGKTAHVCVDINTLEKSPLNLNLIKGLEQSLKK